MSYGTRYGPVKWIIWKDGKCDTPYCPPEVNTPGIPCPVSDILTPGVYSKHHGGFVRVAPSERYVYLTHHVTHHNGRKWRLYALDCPRHLRHIGASLVYVDNVRTKRHTIQHHRVKQWPQGVGVKFPEIALADWATTTVADMWSEKVNTYDTGYPAGPPLSCADAVTGLLDPPKTEVDTEIYRHFEANMHTLLSAPQLPIARAGKTRKVGIVATADFGTALQFRNAPVNSEEHLLAKTRLTTGVVGVGVLPKVGHTTSDGNTRKVFPMSPTLQIGLEKVLGKREPVYPNTTVIKGANFPAHKYTYDVTSCDKHVYPYLRRYVRRHVPQYEKLFLPQVYTAYGVLEPNQFFSGLYGTNHITLCFALAVIRCCTDDHVYIQGDGIMLEDLPCGYLPAMSLLRREPDYTINGFDYSTGVPRYANATKRLESPRLNNPKSITGTFGWAFRREIYKRFLNPTELPPNKTEHDFSTITNRELLLVCQERHVCLRKLKYVGALALTSGSSPWQTTATVAKPVFHDHPITRLDCNRLPSITAENIATVHWLSGRGALPPRTGVGALNAGPGAPGNADHQGNQHRIGTSVSVRRQVEAQATTP